MRGVLTLVSCPRVVVNLQVYFSLLERVLLVSFVFFLSWKKHLRVFSSQLVFWPLIISGQHKIAFWDENSHPLLILGRGIRKLVLKLSVSSSFQDMGTSNIC